MNLVQKYITINSETNRATFYSSHNEMMKNSRELREGGYSHWRSASSGVKWVDGDN